MYDYYNNPIKMLGGIYNQFARYELTSILFYIWIHNAKHELLY
jgi:hypothetical protein